MIRIAAVGDVHAGADSAGVLRPHYQKLGECADLLLVAGDLTRHGTADEAAVFADEVHDVPIPVAVVLGNHDYHCDEDAKIAQVLTDAGIAVLEGSGRVYDVDGARVGVAGTKGFGGGFAGACGSDFGEPEMKAFVAYSRRLADGLEQALEDLDADVKVALTHFSPCEETLRGERLEIYPFLGSYLLAEAIDRGGADLAIHGHAHAGTEKGLTPGGVRVRNVAQPVIQQAYRVYCITGGDGLDCPTDAV